MARASISLYLREKNNRASLTRLLIIVSITQTGINLPKIFFLILVFLFLVLFLNIIFIITNYKSI